MGPTRAASSADLGGSSKYSSEILEDRRGEGFHVTVVEHGSVGPKPNAKACVNRSVSDYPEGKLV